jgi:hypothetical protein
MSSNPPEKTTELVPPDLKAKPSGSQYLGGSRFDEQNTEILNQAVNALWLDNSRPENKIRKQQACLEAMAGIGPQDEIEGMLAAQMIACHSAAMECFRRAMIKEQPFEGRQQNLNFANKLSRTYALHMEALDKHRGKGQQKVTVEHVHVHQGGQAIVGNVNSGGSARISEGQAHEDMATNAYEQAMRSPLTPEREPVPQRRNA